METSGQRRSGFTLIELLVSMAVIALLVSLAAPRYFSSMEKAQETALRENLRQVREAIDKHVGDTGRYPDTLGDLVSKGYLRRPPVDPITDSETTWILVPPKEPGQGGLYDVRSGAPGLSRDGSAYGTW
ncbi:type II secretion system protein [Pseudothauera rhizosphaerae]|nr:type II secretion system protein [Pseudothauera rhizosphaerae]